MIVRRGGPRRDRPSFLALKTFSSRREIRGDGASSGPVFRWWAHVKIVYVPAVPGSISAGRDRGPENPRYLMLTMDGRGDPSLPVWYEYCN
jgi:hypothetical protein